MTGKTTAITLASAGALVALGVLAGCSQLKVDLSGDGIPKPRFIIAFVDETESRGAAWNAMRDRAELIASRLNNKEAFAVIGIDDHGFDEDDVRVPVQVISAESDLDADGIRRQREEIMQKVRALEPRGNPRYTDLVGPIRQASNMADKESQTRRITLVFFSDMQQTPDMPGDSALDGIRFPTRTEAYCFYVAASPKYDFQSTVAMWQRLLSSAGITISANDFHQQGTVDRGIDQAFAPPEF